MTTTDPIADMLTRIRNANQAKFKTVDIPASNMKRNIAEILFNEGYIKAYEEIQNENQGIIRVSLKYTEKGKKVISGLSQYYSCPIIGNTSFTGVIVPDGYIHGNKGFVAIMTKFLLNYTGAYGTLL